MRTVPLSHNEWLGDPLTHLAKSGGTFRARDNRDLESLIGFIPRSFQGVPIEYDISYHFDQETIHGYKLTDCLTKCLWLAPCNVSLSMVYLESLVRQPVTDEGRYVFDQLARYVKDKYLARSTKIKPKQLAVLPGTNLLSKDSVDLGLLDCLVETGYYVKPHPITTPLDLARFKKRYKDRLLDARLKLYPLVASADSLYTCMCSETVFLAALWEKELHYLHPDPPKRALTYAEIMRAFTATQAEVGLAETFQRLLSYPESGFISIYHSAPEQAIQRFFAHYATYPHKESA